MNKTTDLAVSGNDAKLSKKASQEKLSLLARLKMMLPWSKKSKAKSKEMEIYPLF
jgi:hypothetical protein